MLIRRTTTSRSVGGRGYHSRSKSNKGNHMNRLRVIILVAVLAVLFPVRGAIHAQGEAKPINYGDSITAQVKGGTTLVYSFDGAEGDSVTVSIKLKGQG